MKTTRAKFALTATKTEDGIMSVSGSAVYSEDPNHENKSFSDSSPSGSFYMTIAAGKEAQNNFPVGVTKEYYLDITPCPETAEAAGTGE